MKMKKIAALLVLALLAANVSASPGLKEDILETIENILDVLSQIWSKILDIVDILFPTLRDAIERYLDFLDSHISWLAEHHWVYILCGILVLAAVISYVLRMAKGWVINSILALLVLLFLIHGLHWDIEITPILLLASIAFGVPGLLAVLVLQYFGIPI